MVMGYYGYDGYNRVYAMKAKKDTESVLLFVRIRREVYLGEG